jgi:hypothetical protein
LSVSADDFDALQAERDMYRTSADNLALDKLGLQSQLAHLTQQRDGLRSLLEKYGKHADDCNSWSHIGTPGNYECSCGWRAARTAALKDTP